MEKLISYCGLNCAECPALQATKENDDNKRAETAKIWSKIYNADIKPEDINCEWCKSEGVHFNYCNVCDIRKCCIEKEIENCAYCSEYACEKLSKFFEVAKEAKVSLDEIKEQI